MKELVVAFKKGTEEYTKKQFPDELMEQLEISICAIFRSWIDKRAIDYRREFKVTPEQADKTAISVVSMVYCTMGNDSATDVCFTRDPETGENVFFGEYLTNAQGEDVVACIRTPKTIPEIAKELPESYKQLLEIKQKLEHH